MGVELDQIATDNASDLCELDFMFAIELGIYVLEARPDPVALKDLVDALQRDALLVGEFFCGVSLLHCWNNTLRGEEYDSYLNPGPAGIAIPFVGFYRPLWTALGIVAGYGLAALGLTYYLRDRIGAARWRRLHRLTAAFWLLAVGHTIGAIEAALDKVALALIDDHTRNCIADAKGSERTEKLDELMGALTRLMA